MRAQLFRFWLPALLWAALILILSSDIGSSSNTGALMRQLLRFLPEDQYVVTHAVVRKLAHLVGYGILGALNVRALRGGRTGWRLRWALTAVAMAAGIAIVDEYHQTLLSSRTGSGWDVLIDVAGASLAQFLMRLRYSVSA